MLNYVNSIPRLSFKPPKNIFNTNSDDFAGNYYRFENNYLQELINQNIAAVLKYIKAQSNALGLPLHNCCCKKSVSLDSRKTLSLLEVHEAGAALSFSSWFDNSIFSMYSFYIENSGTNPAEMFIQLSPDKISIYDEKNIFTLQPGETRIILPLEYTFFSRLAFRALSGTTTLRIWFQAQV